MRLLQGFNIAHFHWVTAVKRFPVVFIGPTEAAAARTSAVRHRKKMQHVQLSTTRNCSNRFTVYCFIRAYYHRSYLEELSVYLAKTSKHHLLIYESMREEKYSEK